MAAGGSVTFPTQTVTTGSISNAPLTISYTLPTTTNGVLYVIAGHGETTDPARLISGVTYAGTAMVKVIEKLAANSLASGSLWRLKQASLPAPGANDVVITMTSDSITCTTEGIVCTLEGVNQTTPERSTTSSIDDASSSPATVTVGAGNSNANDIIIFGVNAGGALSVPDQTSMAIVNVNDQTGGGNLAAQRATGSASAVTGSWTVAGPDIWRCVAASVQPV